MDKILETFLVDIAILLFFMPMGMLYVGLASLEFNAIIYKPSKESLDVWETKLGSFIRHIYMGKNGNPVFMIYPFDVKKDLFDIQQAHFLIQFGAIGLNLLVPLFFFAIPMLSASRVFGIFYLEHNSEIERIGLTFEALCMFVAVTVLIGKSILFGQSLKRL